MHSTPCPGLAEVTLHTARPPISRLFCAESGASPPARPRGQNQVRCTRARHAPPLRHAHCGGAAISASIAPRAAAAARGAGRGCASLRAQATAPNERRPGAGGGSWPQRPRGKLLRWRARAQPARSGARFEAVPPLSTPGAAVFPPTAGGPHPRAPLRSHGGPWQAAQSRLSVQGCWTSRARSLRRRKCAWCARLCAPPPRLRPASADLACVHAPQALFRVAGCSDASFARACTLLAPLRALPLRDLRRLYPDPSSCPFTQLVRAPRHRASRPASQFRS